MRESQFLIMFFYPTGASGCLGMLLPTISVEASMELIWKEIDFFLMLKVPISQSQSHMGLANYHDNMCLFL